MKNTLKDRLKLDEKSNEARKIARAMSAKPLSKPEWLDKLPVRNEVKSVESQDGIAFAVSPKIYTGDKMVGIATMHKSNAIPIFSNEEAIEVAQMSAK